MQRANLELNVGHPIQLIKIHLKNYKIALSIPILTNK